MSFLDKKVLIISPQSWGKMQLSKQHYANELVNAGAEVFFLNPAQLQIGLQPKFTRKQLNSQLIVIDYTIPFLPSLKYRLFRFFSILNRMSIERFFRQHGIDIDVVWNFDNGLISDILLYRYAKINIFHPVDQLRTPVVTNSYHFVFSLSNEILKSVSHHNKHFINHGLGEVFEDSAKNRLSHIQNVKLNKDKKICAYIGNLLGLAIDRTCFIDIIESCPDIDFWLIGTYETKSNNLFNAKQLDNDTVAFVQKLKELKNAHLLGPKSHQEIIHKFDEIDCFLICYKITSFYKCDNSHKILEYLSSGKPVISSFLSTYEGLDLIDMVDIDDNLKIVELLKVQFGDLGQALSLNKVEKRIRYALSNTYRANLKKIEDIIFDCR